MTAPALSWLHISDLHVGMKDAGSDWHANIDLFLDDVDRVLAETGPVDLVIFTGDISQSGEAVQFAMLDEKVLGPLWQRFQARDSDPVLLAVPGNHDLQWPSSKPDKLFASNLCHNPAPLWEAEQKAVDFVHQRFAAYVEWWKKKRPQRGYIEGLLPGDFLYVHEKDGLRLGVAGLNTAALHLHGGVGLGGLHVHKNQLGRALATGDVSPWLSDNHLNLLLTHHPPDWLDKDNRSEAFYGGLQAGAFDLHLFGHMHEPFGETRHQTSGARQRILQAASLFGLERYTVVGDDGKRSSKSERRYGYLVAQLVHDGASYQLRAWPRRGFLAPGSHWRMGPDGSFALQNQVLAAPLFELTPRWLVLFGHYAGA